MTPANDVVLRLQRLFLQHFHIEVVDPHADLIDAGLLDSLQVVELLVHIEAEFGERLAIDDIELRDLSSLSGIAKLVGAGGHGVPASRKASA